jgi:hypothetical protein
MIGLLHESDTFSLQRAESATMVKASVWSLVINFFKAVDDLI